MVYYSLADNVALLLALGLTYDIVSRNWETDRLSVKVWLGVILGGLGMAVMEASWEYAPGIVFDSRSILLGVGGMFVGGLPTLIAMVITSIARLCRGGDAAWVGVAVIWTSGAMGITWRRFRHEAVLKAGVWELLAFGIVVHAAMLLWMLALPWPLSMRILSTVVVPVLLIYPLGTILLGKLMAGQRARLAMEESLARSEAQYRELVQDARSIILRLDAMARITFFNEYAQSFFGFTAEDTVGRSVLGTIVPAAGTPGRDLAAMVEQVLRNPGLFATNETENVRRNGERVWVAWNNKAYFDDDGKIAGILCVGTDITSRKRAESALRESEERLKRALENIPDVVVIHDPDLKIRYVNAAAQEITGRPTSDFVGKRGDNIWPIELHQAYLPALQKAVDTGAPHAVEVELSLPVGGPRNLRITCVPLLDGNVRIREVLGIIHDFTHRKQAQREIAETWRGRGQERSGRLPETHTKLEHLPCAVSHDLHAATRPAEGFAGALAEDCRETLPPKVF